MLHDLNDELRVGIPKTPFRPGRYTDADVSMDTDALLDFCLYCTYCCMSVCAIHKYYPKYPVSAILPKCKYPKYPMYPMYHPAFRLFRRLSMPFLPQIPDPFVTLFPFSYRRVGVNTPNPGASGVWELQLGIPCGVRDAECLVPRKSQ